MNPEYPDGKACYIPRLERTMRDIPDKYHAFLWDYTGEGKSPHVVQAAVTYIETKTGMEGCANDYGACQSAIKQAVEAMIDRDVVTLEDVRENNYTNGFQTFAEDRSGGKNQHTA